MSSSGVTNYSVTELDVIETAATDIGVLQGGQSLSPEEMGLFRRKLNFIVKQWVAQTDFAPGLKMWTRRRAYLFLQDGQTVYDIGPSGDPCASESYLTTELSVDASSTAPVVADSTGMAIGDHFGVILDEATIQWTTIATLGPLTVDDAINAIAGSRVFSYTAKPLKPFEIVSALLRDTEDNDTPMDPNLSVTEYELIPTKRALGSPSRIYFEPRKDAGRVYLDRSPDDTSKVIRLVFNSYIEDSTASTQDVDFPGEWFRALSSQLAIDTSVAFGRPVAPELKLIRDESLQMAKNAHPLKSVAFYESDPDWYF